MSYHLALESAGAKILTSKAFGSYQGTEWFLVKYKDKIFWLDIPYGSCSGCDHFQDAFGYNHHEHPDDDYFSPFYDEIFSKECKDCQEIFKRLVDFGKSYLDNNLSQLEAEKEASRHIDWDSEANDMLNFIKETGKIWNVK